MGEPTTDEPDSIDTEQPVVESPPVETVEHLGDALKRLAQGAGKDDYDTCLIEAERGLSWNGMVTTEITFPFGFEAKLRASVLKQMLMYLREPTVKVKKTNVLFTEGGRRFQVSRLTRDAFVNEAPMPEEGHPVMGSWMTRLIPVIPTRSGHNMFAGVNVCESGFIGTDKRILVWTEVEGPPVQGVVTRDLIERLPGGELRLHMTDERVWVREGQTVWTAPLLAGTYPEWQGAFAQVTTDRSVTLIRAEVLEAFQVVTSVSQTGYLFFEGDTLKCVSQRGIDPRAKGTEGSVAEAAIPVHGRTGDPFALLFNMRLLLNMLQRCTGTMLTLSTNQRQDAIKVEPEMHPRTHIVQLCLDGSGVVPESTDA